MASEKTNAARASHPSRIVIADAFLCRLPRREEHHTLALREISVPGDRCLPGYSCGRWNMVPRVRTYMREHGSRKSDFQETPIRRCTLEARAPSCQFSASIYLAGRRTGCHARTWKADIGGGRNARDQFAGHEPEFPRRFTLERIASNAKSPVSSARKQARALTE